MKKGKFIRGKEAEQAELKQDYVLIRLFDFSSLRKKSVIERISKTEDKPEFKDFNGWHPFLAEVMNVSVKGKEIADVEPGDIIVVSNMLKQQIERGAVDVVYMDKEELVIIKAADIKIVANYYRDRIENGKPIID